ncbi:hypothetical protein Ciccas_000984 [Cichlidogyrus casuarinus]|uniref:K Homology domain-containing protein n=1 Tax=Cichlidogyrus casuarinus TaxID=1844966 RepID=A0ABD2QLF0_9PLAT
MILLIPYNPKLQHPAKMHIPDASGGERVFVLETSDIPTVCAIARDILEKLKVRYSANFFTRFKDVCNGEASDNRRQYKIHRDQAPSSSDSEPLVDLRVLVHQSQAGSVIGKGGERIKELRNKFKMKMIKVFQVCAPRSSDRVIQMISTIDCVVSCLESMLESINYGGWLSAEGQRVYQQTGQLPQPMLPGMANQVMMPQGAYPAHMLAAYTGNPMVQAGPQLQQVQRQVPMVRDLTPNNRGGGRGGASNRGGRGGGRGGNFSSRGGNLNVRKPYNQMQGMASQMMPQMAPMPQQNMAPNQNYFQNQSFMGPHT